MGHMRKSVSDDYCVYIYTSPPPANSAFLSAAFCFFRDRAIQYHDPTVNRVNGSARTMKIQNSLEIWKPEAGSDWDWKLNKFIPRTPYGYVSSCMIMSDERNCTYGDETCREVD